MDTTPQVIGRVTSSALPVAACLVVAVGMVFYITRDGVATRSTPSASVASAVGKSAPDAALGRAATADQSTPALDLERGAAAVTAFAPDVSAPLPDGAAPEPGGQAAPADAATGAPAASVAGAGAPRVDVMRVEASGSAIIAGTARPGTNVSVLSGDRRLAEVRADEAGRFVAIFEAGTSAEPRALTLESRSEEGTTARSEQVMLILPKTAPMPAVEGGTSTADTVPGTTVPGATGAGQTAAGRTAAETPRTLPEVGATAILTPGSAEVTPVAPPAGVAAGQVVIASISYGAEGAVTLQGFGAPGAAVRVYLDGTLAGEGQVLPDGRWSLSMPGEAPGTYMLRVDQVDAAGEVISRTETPFRRDTGATGPAGSGEVSVVVQPGNNLWSLARVHYGSGIRFSQILDANAAIIIDPNLIYPGQVFRVPATPR